MQTSSAMGHGHELDFEKAELELGDVLWYVSNAAYLLGTDLETIARRNLEKLKKRYPNGFTQQDSINRKE